MLLQHTEFGTYCAQGDFFIDPLRSVPRAVITHAHSDHARRGMDSYLCHHHTAPLLRSRLGKNISCQTVEYGQPIDINGVRVSLHPAGHVAGSAQIRVEWRGQVWVASGDYKRESDPFAAPFEVVKCHTFISESTFGLPVYDWPDEHKAIDDINEWWRFNAQNGMPSVLSAYSLGKSQHILGSVDSSIGPLYVHPSVELMNEAMRSVGLAVPPTHILNANTTKEEVSKALIIAPNVGDGPDWMQDDFAFSRGRASGWFAVRRAARQQPHERGFVLSDHADWKGITKTIIETGCEQVLVNHGFSGQVARYAAEKFGIISGELEDGKTRGLEDQKTRGLEDQKTRGLEEQKTRGIEEQKNGGKIREYVCKETGIAEWLFDECRAHVGSLTETVALLLPKDIPVPEFFGKRIVKGIGDLRAPQALSFRLQALGITLKAYSITTCLLHVHLKTGGRRGFDKFTMGVWLGDELIPLAHVAPNVDQQLFEEISAHVKAHTLVRSGPVRTVTPKFVFEISIAGIDRAPRRKSGVSIAEASIVQYLPDLLPQNAAIHADVIKLL